MKTIAKKEYTSPIVETYKIELQHMIAGSTLDPESPTVTIKDEEWHSAFGAHADDADWEDYE